MITQILSASTSSITEFKQNPLKAVNAGEGGPIAVLNRNKPAFYCVPPELFEHMQNVLDDMDDVALVQEREADKNRKLVKVTPDEL